VRDAAGRRKLNVEIIEWPGGEPVSLRLEVSPDVFNKLARGGKTIPLPPSADLAIFAGLPWYCNVNVQCGPHELDTLCAPAAYSAKAGWHLKVFASADAPVDSKVRATRMLQYRRDGGYLAVR